MPDAKIKENERSWVIRLISDINIFLRGHNLQIKRLGGENTISLNQSHMFPDVILYGDIRQNQILQGWEVKLPDTPITDQTFITDAQRKANSLGLNSCFIWNFQAGVLYVKGENGTFEILRQWNETNNIQNRYDVETYYDQWYAVICRIVIEINEFFIAGQLSSAGLGKIISNNVAANIIIRNKYQVAENLRKLTKTNTRIEAYISAWWSGVEIDYVSDEIDKFDAYSKVLLVHWVNRFLFAHLIKRYHNGAMRVNTLNYESTQIIGNNVFSEISRDCDYFNIFTSIKYNDCLPVSTWNDLIELNLFLIENKIESIDQDSLQTILENTVSASRKEITGQYTTPKKLAELLVKITVVNFTEPFIDPCCGTGSITKAVLKEKKNRLKNLGSATQTSWASDKYDFPLQIASISLTDIDSINLPSYVFKSNVFSLHVGDVINLHSPIDGSSFQEVIPQFGSIVSNLPFVPFERIQEDELEFINRLKGDIAKKTQLTLDRRSDIYFYVVFKLWQLLTENGRLGIITSNSWLGTEAGNIFFELLRKYFEIEQFHISGVGRWFENAKVVTIITILTKKSEVSEPSREHKTAFFLWMKTLTELEQQDEDCVTLINSSLLQREFDNKVVQVKEYSTNEIDALVSMNLSINSLFYDVAWLTGVRDNLCPISEIFSIIRGERRGWDRLFYPKDRNEIEPQYLKRVLLSSRQIEMLQTTAESDAFCCSLSIDELNQLRHNGAVDWIHRFEHQVNEKGKPLTQTLKRTNMYWYEMDDSKIVDFVTSMNPDRRLFFALFDTPSFINQRLIGLKTRGPYEDRELYHALLNSIIGMFYIEAIGFGRGLGALDINKETLSKALMLNPNRISSNNRQLILEKFASLKSRAILPTNEELLKEDRLSFEHEVLHSFGMDNYFVQIRNSLLSMQQSRLNARRL